MNMFAEGRSAVFCLSISCSEVIRWLTNTSVGGAGIALRVPTPNVSVVDLVIQTEKKTFAEEVNEAFRESSRGPQKVCIREILPGLLLN